MEETAAPVAAATAAGGFLGHGDGSDGQH